MLWINFLHLYQPANIDSWTIKQALEKSYWRLLRLLEEHPDLKMTWNISGCLLARLRDEGEHVFLNRLKKLVVSGRLELTSSAAYHGLLPLLPESEVIRQVKENEKILTSIFGSKFKPAGFFFPEMAFSSDTGKIIRKLGYRFAIVDEFAFDGGLSRPDFNKIYKDEISGLRLIFRNRVLSNSYPPDKLLPLLIKEAENNKDIKSKAGNIQPVFKFSRPIITATDAELYGLRHQDHTAEIERMAKMENLRTETISSFLSRLSSEGAKKIVVKAVSCSWESSRQEIKEGRAFRLWQDKKNRIHVQLWKLANLAFLVGDKFKHDKNYAWHRWHLVRGIASCTFWWASARDFSKIFGPYAWSPDIIERGLEDLIRAVRALEDKKTRKYKLQAEKYYLKTKKLIWEEHWKKHWPQTS